MCCQCVFKTAKVAVGGFQNKGDLNPATQAGDAPNINDLGKLTATMQKVVAGELTLPSGCSNEYLFPNMAWTNDHMHMYFNSLEEAVVKDEDWGRFEHQLRHGVVSFINNKGLRQRFQSLLPKHERNKFHCFSKTHVDWKWEYLEDALGQLEPILDDMLRPFHCQLG